MTTGDDATQLLERLAAIQWPPRFDDTRLRSYLALIKEYLRRAAMWVGPGGVEGWPFFDIAEHVQPTMVVPPTLSAVLEDRLQRGAYSLDERQLQQFVLHWGVAKSHVIASRPDPYEPMIRFWERGGRFTREHDMIVVGGPGVLRRTPNEWLSTAPLQALDDASLDALDQTQSDRKVG